MEVIRPKENKSINLSLKHTLDQAHLLMRLGNKWADLLQQWNLKEKIRKPVMEET